MSNYVHKEDCKMEVKFSCRSSKNSAIGQNICEYTALPSLNVSYVDNVCHLTNLDADLNMPVDTNFSHYTLHDFHSNFDI